jgi:hypothetical protein
MIACWLLGLSAATPARAQEVANSFHQLSVVAHYGDTVRIVDTDGREIRGMIYRVTESQLEVDVVKTGMATWRESDIRTIRRRINDPLSNGARNGFIAGSLVGLAAGLALRGTHIRGIVPLSVAVYGGLGTCVGVGIDVMVTEDELIYDRAPEATPARSTASSGSSIPSLSRSSRGFAVSPVVTRDARGVVVSLSF